MRKTLASIAITIMAGAHSASFVVNPYPGAERGVPPLQRIGGEQLAQGYYGYGPQYLPRWQRNPEYDRPYYVRPDRGWRTPDEDQFDRSYHRWQFYNRHSGNGDWHYGPR